jgi:hypothetical protein
MKPKAKQPERANVPVAAEQLKVLSDAELARCIAQALEETSPRVTVFIRAIVEDGLSISAAAEKAGIQEPHKRLAHDGAALMLCLSEEARRSPGVTSGMLSKRLLKLAEGAEAEGEFQAAVAALKEAARINSIGDSENKATLAIASPVNISIDLSRADDGAEEERERRLALARRTVEVREQKEIHGTTTRRPRDVIQKVIEAARVALPVPPEELN